MRLMCLLTLAHGYFLYSFTLACITSLFIRRPLANEIIYLLNLLSPCLPVVFNIRLAIAVIEFSPVGDASEYTTTQPLRKLTA